MSAVLAGQGEDSAGKTEAGLGASCSLACFTLLAHAHVVDNFQTFKVRSNEASYKGSLAFIYRYRDREPLI